MTIISANGQSEVLPGFRFHPTEEELLYYYLKKKLSNERFDLQVIQDVDLNKLEPWDIQEKCIIGATIQTAWYFFSHKDKKYPTGSRTNRATAAGFWKATGRDKIIYRNGSRIGMRKTLVFYKGRAPHGLKSDWIMYEYRLDDNSIVSNVVGEGAQNDGWVVCRIFKKKYHHKTLESSPSISSSSNISVEGKLEMFNSWNNGGALEQMFEYKCNEENESNSSFMKIPSLESPNSSSRENNFPSLNDNNEDTIAKTVSSMDPNNYPLYHSGLTNWAAFDRLVASQLNGHIDTSSQFACLHEVTMAYCNHLDVQLPTLMQSISLPFNRPANHGNHQDYSNETELWNFTSG